MVANVTVCQDCGTEWVVIALTSQRDTWSLVTESPGAPPPPGSGVPVEDTQATIFEVVCDGDPPCPHCGGLLWIANSGESLN